MASESYRSTLAREQKANQSTASEWERFRTHRDALTDQLLSGLPPRDAAGPSLCVLGAGNCNDLDLARLTRHFGSIHLVDLDRSAIERARERCAPEERRVIECHAPVDLSGLLDVLPRWKRMQLTPEELMRQPSSAVERLVQSVGRRFDRVLSACVWTQMHLAVLQELGAEHRLFTAVSRTLSLVHLRTVCALTEPGGKALFATEITANRWVNLASEPADGDWLSRMYAIEREGHTIAVARPSDLLAIAADDPVLRTQSFHDPHRAWLWRQGPEQLFLTYALWIERLSETTHTPPA